MTRLLSSLVYGTTVTGPAMFLVTAISLTLTAIPACLIPAARAASVDPITALRRD